MITKTITTAPAHYYKDFENKKLKTERKIKMKNYVKNNDLTVTITMSEEEFENHFCFCDDCGSLLFINDAVRIDDTYYCESCTTSCVCCGTVIATRDAYQTCDSDYDYCHDCYVEQTYRCDDCGARYRYEDELHEVDDYYYCDTCYEQHRPIINSYHTQKEYGKTVFYGNADRRNELHIGFELEVDSNEQFDREEIAGELQNRFGDFFAYENDGSLHFGFEAISQPATLSYHLNMMDKYSDAFEYLLENGVKSHDVGTCGLHIHLDRRYFGCKEDSSIAKLLYIFERFRPELMRFSRRTEAQSSDWCRSRKKNYNGKAGWIKQAVMESKAYSNYHNRYYAVNLTNDNTLEIRLWRGTLNKQTFEATLKFTQRLADICKYTRAVELAKMTFEELLGSDEVILSYWNRINNK